MDLRYVETFYRAVLLGSIAAAAAELNVVPRAASQRIRCLESELHTDLLDRSAGKRLRLTPAGMRFFHEAKRILDLWGEIKEGIRGSDLSRPLRVGYGDSIELRRDELPVFWACGVTPQAAIERARLELCITHAPGAMLITDLHNAVLATC